MKQAWILFLCLSAALPSLTLAQDGTQRQTKLVLPKVGAPDVKPELVVLPQMVLRGPVDGVCFSADGRTAASWSDEEILVWDMAARRARCLLPIGATGEWDDGLERPHKVQVCLSPDGARAGDISQSPNDRPALRVWDARDGRLVSTCRVANGDSPHLTVSSPAFSPDGSVVAAAVSRRGESVPQSPEGDAVALYVWDASSGQQLATVDLPVDDPRPEMTVVAFAADGALLVCQPEYRPKGDHLEWDFEYKWQAQAPLRLAGRGEWAPGHPVSLFVYRASTPKVSADGRWLACTWWPPDRLPRLGLWDTARGSAVTSFPVGTTPGSSARVVACSATRALVTDSGDEVRIGGSDTGQAACCSWDWRTQQATQLRAPLTEMTGQDTGKVLVAWPVLTADGGLMALGGRVYDTESGASLVASATNLAARVRFEDRGRRLVWCDELGQVTDSWPLDGAAQCSANGPQLGDTVLYRDPNVSAWAGSGGLRVVSQASGEETLLPRETDAYHEVLGLLTRDWIDGTLGDRWPRNDGKAVVARRPDGTVVVAAIALERVEDGDTRYRTSAVALTYAHADGTVVTSPPLVPWAALGETRRDDGSEPRIHPVALALSPEGARLAWCLSSRLDLRVVTWDLDTGSKLWDATLPEALPFYSPPWFTPSDASLVLPVVRPGLSFLDSRTGDVWNPTWRGQLHAFTSDLAWCVGSTNPTEWDPVAYQDSLRPLARVLRLRGQDDRPLDLVLWRAADGAEMRLASGSEFVFRRSRRAPMPFDPGRRLLSVGMWTGRGHPGCAPLTDWFACTDLSPDDRRLAVSQDDGVTHLWELPPRGLPGQDPALAATFVHDLSGAAGAAAIPQGYVWSSPGAERLLGWRLGESVYPYEQFAERYERPDLVRKVLAGGDISGERGLTGEMIPPTAAFLAPEYDAKVSGKSVKVEIEVAGVRPLKKVDLLMDGRPVSDDIVATAKEETIEPNHVVISLDLPMSASARRIRLQAYAYDEEMLRSKAAEVTFTREGAAPSATALYVLSVGVTTYRNTAWNNLRYADADATSFAAISGEAASRRLLVNENATSSGVKFALEQMKSSVTEDDVAAIFLAGHGILGPNGDYYFLLHDSDEKDLANTALKWDDFVSALKALRAKLVMVFADTCHSGSLTGSESVNTLIDRLNKKAGVVVFTASRGDEASIEREDWGHGAFTKALLEGFAGKADTYPKDKLVSLAELKEYVIPRVEELTGKRQHPFLPRVEDFDPAQPIASVIAEVK